MPDSAGMPLDCTPFQKAIASLERALERYCADTSDEEVRDSVIQRFEFTYDLSHKMLRRVLEATMPTDDVGQATFPELIRTGGEEGLLPSSWPAWKSFRELRNITSHTYDKAKAVEVARQVPAFLQEARELARRLAKRLES